MELKLFTDMYTIYNNINCITSKQFIDMFGYNAYHDGKKRNHFIKHGYGGNGREVYIEVNNTMRRDYREKIIKEFGPAEKIETTSYKECIVIDEKAREFFKELVLDDSAPDKSHLHESNITIYTNEASLLNTIQLVIKNQIKSMGARGKRPSIKEQYEGALKFIKEVEDRFPNKLPKNRISLQRKLEKYIQSSYISLISNYGNDNSLKRSKDSEEWLLARWSSKVNKVTLSQLHFEYNVKAIENGWKHLKSLEALSIWLNKPEIKSKWVMAREGEDSYIATYIRKHRTNLPTLRDSLWYSDGTKLNYFYQETITKDGKTTTVVKTCTVYEVMDAYSEVFLGHAFAPTEKSEMQYPAFKEALQFAGHKPYELRFDNQGGHRKLDNQCFLDKVAKLSIFTQPYNAPSKTIESAFGRFQQQYLHRDWFFTGQNIQAVKKESKINVDFISANIKNLPTLPEVKRIYNQRRKEWNEAPHPKTGIPRIEMYRNSVNKESKNLEIWDMIDIFWLMTTKESTYRASGIEITIDKAKHAYEVQTTEGMPNLDFLKNNSGRKFFVKYDPDDLTLAALYTKDAIGLRFVANLQPYIKIQRNIQEQIDGDMAFIKGMEIANKALRLQALEETETLMENHGEHPGQHGLNMPGIKGVSKKYKDKVLTSGNYMKTVSEVMVVADNKEDYVSLYGEY